MLQPEQILSNWEDFLRYIDTYITGDRGVKLKAFYLKYDDRFLMMPAAHKPQYHNCFPGGYIDHVNRVIEGALKIDSVWREMGVVDTYSTEELVSIINSLTPEVYYEKLPYIEHNYNEVFKNKTLNNLEAFFKEIISLNNL